MLAHLKIFLCTLSTFCLNWVGVVMLPALILHTSFPETDKPSEPIKPSKTGKLSKPITE